MSAFAALASGFTPGDVDAIFKRLDQDGDGKVTREEFSLYKVDAITYRSESETQNPDRAIAARYEDVRINRATFSALDVDGNGTLSGSEIVAAPLLQFEAIDTNGDGQIDRNELAQLIQRISR